MWKTTTPPSRLPAERGYDIKVVRDVIRMIERSEYKRQQAAPGLKDHAQGLWVGQAFPNRTKIRSLD